MKPGDPVAFTSSSLITIGKIAVDPKMSNNCYLLTCDRTGERLLIDPADEAETIEREFGTEFTGVVITHQHWDHHRALAAVVEKCPGVPVYAGVPDAAAITEQTGIAVSHPLEHGATITFGDAAVEVIAIAGHTPGSISLLHRDPEGHPHLFTGDTLFPGGVGSTFGDAEAFVQLLGEVETKYFDTLPDDTHFYPGHGDDSTIGAERPHLSEWRERGW